MVKRHHQIDFASGALVFPGGKTHAGDHDPAWVDHADRLGRDRAATSGRCASPPCARPMRRPASSSPETAPARRFRGDERAHAARDAIAKDERPFLDLVRGAGRFHRPDGADRLRALDHAAADAQAVRHLVLCRRAPTRAAGGVRRLGDGRRRMDRAGARRSARGREASGR